MAKKKFLIKPFERVTIRKTKKGEKRFYDFVTHKRISKEKHEDQLAKYRAGTIKSVSTPYLKGEDFLKHKEELRKERVKKKESKSSIEDLTNKSKSTNYDVTQGLDWQVISDYENNHEDGTINVLIIDNINYKSSDDAFNSSILRDYLDKEQEELMEDGVNSSDVIFVYGLNEKTKTFRVFGTTIKLYKKPKKK